MTEPDVDVAIVGGGLAGLSLAVRLAQAGGPSVAVLEPRPAYARDRTWCFWPLRRHPFAAAVDRSWPAVAVDGPGGPLRLDRGLPYQRIPADRLYALAQDRLARSDTVRLHTGVRVDGLAENADRVRLDTSAGPMTARIAVDTRPPRPGPAAWTQAFAGFEVETARPRFAPDTATLMAFRPEPGAVRFFYVLPDGPTRALVEETRFLPTRTGPPDPETAAQAVARYVGPDLVAQTPIERAAIPMDPGLTGRPPPGRIVPLGVRGGAGRAATGYAFLAIQRQADALAARLVRQDPATFGPMAAPAPRSTLVDAMDRLFLDVLRRRTLDGPPEAAPALFEALFRRVPTPALQRFLGDAPRPADLVRVAAALPTGPFLAELARPAPASPGPAGVPAR
jgi:lycopene beta-cyclase